MSGTVIYGKGNDDTCSSQHFVASSYIYACSSKSSATKHSTVIRVKRSKKGQVCYMHLSFFASLFL